MSSFREKTDFQKLGNSPKSEIQRKTRDPIIRKNSLLEVFSSFYIIPE